MSEPPTYTLVVGPLARQGYATPLTNGVSYTFTVSACADGKWGEASVPSDTVTPSITNSLTSRIPLFLSFTPNNITASVFVVIDSIPSGSPIVVTTDGTTVPDCLAHNPTPADTTTGRINITVKDSGVIMAVGCESGKTASRVARALVLPPSTTYQISENMDVFDRLYVAKSAVLDVAATSEDTTLIVASLGKIEVGGTIHGSAIRLQSSSTVAVLGTGKISADARGYSSGGPGAGASSGGGGGHGGVGGGKGNELPANTSPKSGNDQTASSQYGRAYGDYQRPTTFGSAGGASSGKAPSGFGGGRIHIVAKEQMILHDGSIVSSDGGDGYWKTGTNGDGSAGGGAGGSVWIETPEIRGSGKIHANGGRGYSQFGFSGGCKATDPASGAGGGGGGRVFMNISRASLPTTIQLSAYGMNQVQTGGNLPMECFYPSGGSGTVFIVDVARPHGELVIDNGGNSAWCNTGRSDSRPSPCIGGCLCSSLRPWTPFTFEDIKAEAKMRVLPTPLFHHEDTESKISVQVRHHGKLVVPSDNVITVAKFQTAGDGVQFEMFGDIIFNAAAGLIRKSSFVAKSGLHFVIHGSANIRKLDNFTLMTGSSCVVTTGAKAWELSVLDIQSGSTMDISYDSAGETCTIADRNQLGSNKCAAPVRLVVNNFLNVAGSLTMSSMQNSPPVSVNLLSLNAAVVSGILSVDSLEFQTNLLRIESTGKISADARGYSSGGPGAGASSGGGGGHGGVGGGKGNELPANTSPKSGNDQTASSQYGRAYGDYQRPTTFGSAGGASSGKAPSGFGGGRIHIVAKEQMILHDGSIVSSDGGDGYWKTGTNGDGSAGGGAGGSVWIETPEIRGSGKIHANGGRGYSQFGFSGGCKATDPASGAGGGGGGRVFMNISRASLPTTIQLSAYGMNQVQTGGNLPMECFYPSGGSGTVFIVDVARPHGELVIDNGGNSAWCNTGRSDSRPSPCIGGCLCSSLRPWTPFTFEDIKAEAKMRVLPTPLFGLSGVSNVNIAAKSFHGITRAVKLTILSLRGKSHPVFNGFSEPAQDPDYFLGLIEVKNIVITDSNVVIPSTGIVALQESISYPSDGFTYSGSFVKEVVDSEIQQFAPYFLGLKVQIAKDMIITLQGFNTFYHAATSSHNSINYAIAGVLNVEQGGMLVVDRGLLDARYHVALQAASIKIAGTIKINCDDVEIQSATSDILLTATGKINKTRALFRSSSNSSVTLRASSVIVANSGSLVAGDNQTTFFSYSESIAGRLLFKRPLMTALVHSVRKPVNFDWDTFGIEPKFDGPYLIEDDTFQLQITETSGIKDRGKTRKITANFDFTVNKQWLDEKSCDKLRCRIGKWAADTITWYNWNDVDTSQPSYLLHIKEVNASVDNLGRSCIEGGGDFGGVALREATYILELDAPCKASARTNFSWTIDTTAPSCRIDENVINDIDTMAIYGLNETTSIEYQIQRGGIDSEFQPVKNTSNASAIRRITTKDDFCSQLKITGSVKVRFWCVDDVGNKGKLLQFYRSKLLRIIVDQNQIFTTPNQKPLVPGVSGVKFQARAEENDDVSKYLYIFAEPGECVEGDDMTRWTEYEGHLFFQWESGTWTQEGNYTLVVKMYDSLGIESEWVSRTWIVQRCSRGEIAVITPITHNRCEPVSTPSNVTLHAHPASWSWFHKMSTDVALVGVSWEWHAESVGNNVRFQIRLSSNRDFQSILPSNVTTVVNVGTRQAVIEFPNAHALWLHPTPVFIQVAVVGEGSAWESSWSTSTVNWKRATECSDTEYEDVSSSNPLVWQCASCPVGASCIGPIIWSGVKAKFGYARCTTPHDSTRFEKCSFAAACLGGPNFDLKEKFDSNISQIDNAEKCNIGYVTNSTLCSRCAPQFSHDNSLNARCDQCPPYDDNVALTVLGVIVTLVAIIAYIQLVLIDAGDLDESDGVKSIGLSFIQLITLLVTFPIAWPPLFVAIFHVGGTIAVFGQHIVNLKW